MQVQARLGGMLDRLEARHLRRHLRPAEGLDFASNDYLGLAGSALLAEAGRAALDRGVPVGAGGARLLRGNHPEHVALEHEAARFFRAEAALFMGGGFQANQAIFSTLPAAGDLIVHDALVHASAHEGMRLGRAETRAFAHNDVEAARAAITGWRAAGHRGQVWIAVESVYSMEGDVAPLPALARLAQAHDAVLVVDEAHATGVFGPQGRGLAQDLEPELGGPEGATLLTLHTCGKGLGVAGALICGPRVMIEALVNRARPFVFATAPAPLTAALVRAALAHLAADDRIVQAAAARIAHAAGQARRIGLPTRSPASQILPVMLGCEATALRLAAGMQARGFDLRAIRPPTVPRGTARLRISITGSVGPDDITALFDALHDLMEAPR